MTQKRLAQVGLVGYLVFLVGWVPGFVSIIQNDGELPVVPFGMMVVGSLVTSISLIILSRQRRNP